jgi:hypothetical protein
MNYQNFANNDFTSPPLFHSRFTMEEKQEQCNSPNTFTMNCQPSSKFGYHKPLNEIVKPIRLEIDKTNPEMECSSLWNNLTRRKSLVKDY